jgi:DNA-directed RNA polymerase II subunit RPB7
MFFIKDLALNLTLHPSYFGANMNDYLRQKLLTDVEGTCTGQFGYIVCVLDSTNIDVGKGRIVPGNSGHAEFEVKYKAVVWKPFKGEVVDGVVSSVNNMGFFADVGPLSVFISKHLIPSDMKYNPSHTPPAYIGDDQVVMKGAKVRIKIIGTRADVNSISAIGSIKEDYLGPL